MTEQYFPDPVIRQRLYVGPLAAYIDEFAALLASQGYASEVAKEKLRLVAHVSRWLHRKKLRIEDLDEDRIRQFLRHRRRQGVVGQQGPATGKAVLAHLRELGRIPVPPEPIDDNAVDRIACDFARFLAQERGLASVTILNYVSIVRCFLSERFGAGAVRLGELCPNDVNQFIFQQASKVSPRRAQLTVTALRSFLRYLRQRGDITTDLVAAVPTVANWRLAPVPKALPPAQVEHLLRSCNLHTAAGQRDHALLLLLARLGLRAAEVVAMTLDDIDWEAGVLIVRGKGARREPLPLPQDVGEALVNYLAQGRPRCATRRLFVRLHAPHRGFASSCAVCDVVQRALARAGLNPALKGAHLLRHSLATRLLRNGASLAEIGELLRHRRPETTQIYAKVDVGALRALAQPWPGGAR